MRYSAGLQTHHKKMKHIPQSGFDQWFGNYLELDYLKEGYIDHVIDDSCAECKAKLEKLIEDGKQHYTINLGPFKWEKPITKRQKQIKDDSDMIGTILVWNENIYKTVREISEGMTEEQFVDNYNKKHKHDPN